MSGAVASLLFLTKKKNNDTKIRKTMGRKISTKRPIKLPVPIRATPQDHREDDRATKYPTLIALGCTWIGENNTRQNPS